MNKIEDLICRDENSCMATAVNIYFGERLFGNGQDLWERQREYVKKMTGQTLSEFDGRLISTVQVGINCFKRKYIFILRNVSLGNWPERFKGGHKRAIVDYRISGREEHHCEAIQYENGKITYLRDDTLSILPYTNKTVREYIEDGQTDLNLALCAYYYIRQR
jgi:hypothetical protein